MTFPLLPLLFKLDNDDVLLRRLNLSNRSTFELLRGADRAQLERSFSGVAKLTGSSR